MHLECRSFTGLASIRRSRITPRSRKTGTDGFQESKLFEELFAQIVLQCVEVGISPETIKPPEMLPLPVHGNAFQQPVPFSTAC
jgi:hypothetical protein